MGGKSGIFDGQKINGEGQVLAGCVCRVGCSGRESVEDSRSKGVKIEKPEWLMAQKGLVLAACRRHLAWLHGIWAGGHFEGPSSPRQGVDAIVWSGVWNMDSALHP
jgi:hypothetical protein